MSRFPVEMEFYNMYNPRLWKEVDKSIDLSKKLKQKIAENYLSLNNGIMSLGNIENDAKKVGDLLGAFPAPAGPALGDLLGALPAPAGPAVGDLLGTLPPHVGLPVPKGASKGSFGTTVDIKKEPLADRFEEDKALQEENALPNDSWRATIIDLIKAMGKDLRGPKLSNLTIDYDKQADELTLGPHVLVVSPTGDLLANGHKLIKPSLNVIKLLIINNNFKREGEAEGALHRQIRLLTPVELNTLKNFYTSLGIYNGASKKFLILSEIKGKGLRVSHAVQYYKNLDELVDRLHLIIASKQAGNTSKDLKSEASEIIGKLLVAKKITRQQSSKLHSLII